ncbi:MAG: hypothetical protein U0T81_10265 [Saprospiraceae bacterium]
MMYSFFYEDFSGFYLEGIKPRDGQVIHGEVLNKTINFEKICK